MGQESSVVKSMAIPLSGFIEAGTEYVIDGGTSTAALGSRQPMRSECA
jgi:hypothetical protein